MRDMRAGFVTCVQLGLGCMEEIYDVGGSIALAVTLRDDLAPRKAGRVFLDQFCAARAIDLVKIRHINDAETVSAIRDRNIDWLFVVGWSQIAGQAVLDVPFSQAGRRSVFGTPSVRRMM